MTKINILYTSIYVLYLLTLIWIGVFSAMLTGIFQSRYPIIIGILLIAIITLFLNKLDKFLEIT